MKGYEREGLPLRSLAECVRISEEAASWRRAPDHPRARVVAVAVNTAGLDAARAEQAIRNAAAETKLPAADPIRQGAAGADRLATAILTARMEGSRSAPRGPSPWPLR